MTQPRSSLQVGQEAGALPVSFSLSVVRLNTPEPRRRRRCSFVCHFRASRRSVKQQTTSPAKKKRTKKLISIDASCGQDGGVRHGGRGAVVRPAGPGAR